MDKLLGEKGKESRMRVGAGYRIKKVSKYSPSKAARFQQRHDKGEGRSQAGTCGRLIQTEGKADAKALGQACAPAGVGGAGGKPAWLGEFGWGLLWNRKEVGGRVCWTSV